MLDYIKSASGNPDYSPTIDWDDFTEDEFENEEDAVAYASRKLFAAAGDALSDKQAENQEKIENAEIEINTAKLIITSIEATNTRLQTDIETVTESIKPLCVNSKASILHEGHFACFHVACRGHTRK